MAGMYIHIPFCKKACHYCDFHFSTSLRSKDKVVDTICKEIELKNTYTSSHTLNTIYFGGGTPSLLSPSDLNKIFETIHQFYEVNPQAEITLEANPDDLTPSKIKELVNSPINRLSIGIQSFRDKDLVWMNRAHKADQATSAVENAQKAGFNNITIDLIYGIPGLSKDAWRENLKKAFALNIQHISAYCLTVEEGTSLGYRVAKNQSKDVDDDEASTQFEIMLEAMNENGFEQYEISNFAKDGCYSKHNSNYWNKTPYIGIGPSAHSFDGTSREWNVANNKKYVDSINENIIPSEKETLSKETRYNEYILTGLRTKWGVNLIQIKDLFGEEIQNFLLNTSKKFLSSKYIERKDNCLILTPTGKLFADKIAADLFIVDDMD